MKLKWDNDGIKTPLARARGFGSSHHGAGHWLHERITSLLLIPLTLWLVWHIVALAGADYAKFTGWLARPGNAIMMIFTIVIAFYHAALGCQAIIEDYVHHEGLKTLKLIGVKLFFGLAGLACVFSILKIALA